MMSTRHAARTNNALTTPTTDENGAAAGRVVVQVPNSTARVIDVDDEDYVNHSDASEDSDAPELVNAVMPTKISAVRSPRAFYRPRPTRPA